MIRGKHSDFQIPQIHEIKSILGLPQKHSVNEPCAEKGHRGTHSMIEDQLFNARILLPNVSSTQLQVHETELDECWTVDGLKESALAKFVELTRHALKYPLSIA
jgi:hypothetical protein